MKNIFTFALIISSLLSIENEIYGQVFEQWENLKNIDSLYVLENISKDAEDLGLSKSRIKNIVELRLRREGIKIVKNIMDLCISVNIDIHAIKYINGKYSDNVSLWMRIEIEEFVYLRRSGKFKFIPTWSSIRVGGSPKSDFLEWVEKGLNECIDEFLNDYYKANPK